MRSAVLALLLMFACAPAFAQAPLVPRGSTWRYLEGRTDPPTDWRSPAFDDSSWTEGKAGFGYGDNDDATVLEDMLENTVTLYIRRSFDVERPADVKTLVLNVSYDDGFVAWLNGQEIARRGLVEPRPSRTAVALDHEATSFETIAVPGAEKLLVPGRNVLAIEGHNSALTSTDFSLDAELAEAQPDVLSIQATTPPTNPGDENEPEIPERPEHAPIRSRPTDQRITWSTTFATYHVSNYFQGHGGTPRDSVTGEVARQEVALRLGRESRTRLTLRVEGQHVGSLGTDLALVARASFKLRQNQSLSVQANALWNRPAYRLVTPAGTKVGHTDSLDSQISWLIDAPFPKASPLSFNVWLYTHRENLDIDSTRDARDRTLGASVRFLRKLQAFSPEVGFEDTARSSNSRNNEYNQHGVLLKMRSIPVKRLYLSALIRWTSRGYREGDALVYSNANRNDTQRLARVSADITASRHFAVSTFWSREEGLSSYPGGGYSTWTTWAGVTWTP